MSGSRRKAGIRGCKRNVRYGPKTDSQNGALARCRCSKQIANHPPARVILSYTTHVEARFRARTPFQFSPRTTDDWPIDGSGSWAFFLAGFSFPLYLVQAAVIYSFSVRGLDILASFGLEPSAQRWIVGIATIPVTILFAALFCPVNDSAVTLSRRLGSALLGHRDQPVRAQAA
jgi:hypothetical protein